MFWTFCPRSHNLAQSTDLVFAVAVNVSLGLGLALGLRVALLVQSGVAGACAGFCGTGFRVLHVASGADAAVDGVGAGRYDGAVVVRVRVRGASDGREEGGRRVAVPAGCFAHFGQVHSVCADGADACVAVLLFAVGAGYVPEVGAVAGERLLHGVLASDGVGIAADVADVVARPCAHGVRLDH